MTSSIKLTFILLILTFCNFNANASDELPLFIQIPTNLRKCPLDSPEIYTSQVYQHELEAFNHEGRAFFGSLLEALELALDEDFKKSFEESWIITSETILVGQEYHSDTIQNLWSLVISRWESGRLPWERRLKHPLMIELLTAIGSQHLELQSVFYHGLQAILKPIQPHVAKTLKRLETELLASGDTSTQNLAARLDKIIEEIEPNFIGKLLVALVRRDTTGLSFVGQLLEEVAILIEAFRARAPSHPFFWTEITKVLSKNVQSEDEIIQRYVSSYEQITQTLLQILQEIAH